MHQILTLDPWPRWTTRHFSVAAEPLMPDHETGRPRRQPAHALDTGRDAVQLAVDMFVATDAPARHGYAFADVMVEGWGSVAGDDGLDEAAFAEIQQVMESYWVICPVLSPDRGSEPPP